MPSDAYQLDKPFIDDGTNRIRTVYPGRNVALGGAIGAHGGRIQLATGDRIVWDDGSSIGGTFDALSPEDFGAKGDAQQVTDGTTINGDATVSSTSNPFTVDDIGKAIRIRGAGAAGADLQTTIAGFDQATGTIELTAAPSTAIAGTAIIDWATDDGAALQAWLNALAAQDGGGLGQLEGRRYGVLRNLGLTSASNIAIQGLGMGASAIVDLRIEQVGAGSGALTGAYAGLLSFVTCSLCSVSKLTLIGTWRLAAANTALGGRKATYSNASSRIYQVEVEAIGFIDEAIYAQADCPGWVAERCYVHDSYSNAFNLNSSGTTSAGSRVVNNEVYNVQHSAVLVTARSVIVAHNVCRHTKSGTFGSDVIVIDAGAIGICAHNVVQDYWCSAGVAMFQIFGNSNADALVIAEGNIVESCKTAAALGVTEGGCFQINGKASSPLGTYVLRNNTARKLNATNPAVVNCIVSLIQLGDGARVYIDGNLLQGNAADQINVGVYETGSHANARIQIGTNNLLDVTTQYQLSATPQKYGADHYRFGAAPSDSGVIRCSRNSRVVTAPNGLGTGDSRYIDIDASGNLYLGRYDAIDNIGVTYVNAASTVALRTPYGVAKIDSAGIELNTKTMIGSELAAVPHLGQLSATAGRFAADGDAQRSSVNVFRSSTDAAATELTLDGGAPAAGTRVVIPTDHTYTFTIDAVTRCTAGTDVGKSASWHIVGTIENVGGTVALVGSCMNLLDSGLWSTATWTPRGAAAALAAATLVPSADDPNNCLALTLTGVVGGAANTFHTNADIRFAEVG